MSLLAKRKQDPPPQESDSDSEDARVFKRIDTIRAANKVNFSLRVAGLFDILNAESDDESDDGLTGVTLGLLTSDLTSSAGTVTAAAGTFTAVAAFTTVAAGTATAGTAPL